MWLVYFCSSSNILHTWICDCFTCPFTPCPSGDPPHPPTAPLPCQLNTPPHTPCVSFHSHHLVIPLRSLRRGSGKFLTQKAVEGGFFWSATGPKQWDEGEKPPQRQSLLWIPRSRCELSLFLLPRFLAPRPHRRSRDGQLRVFSVAHGNSTRVVMMPRPCVARGLDGPLCSWRGNLPHLHFSLHHTLINATRGTIRLADTAFPKLERPAPDYLKKNKSRRREEEVGGGAGERSRLRHE
ncbi:unnamed protein product [Pleuronectes platessa]|uniref:Uncharacterized protein n=1 Tax=Pleuronectes platessa TaxID=8262 RepID=A0A9N7U601_PLEPL|nr:unnamed protein product [Pleuronectes platessa]